MKIKLFILIIIAILGLSACANDTSQEDNNANSSSKETMNHEEMNHTGSGEIPEGLKVAENPVYKVGSKAIIKADHMEGMKGAEATIVGALPVVSYTPTTGGEKVTNHKWVIQEEIKDAGTEEIAPGTEVTLEADHMEGMKGATAEIESAEKTIVYMVDYTPTTGGEKVTNHKWVTESELSDK